jgi:ATP adenylyltransferase
MDSLWAPWRNVYIKAKPKNKCLFCIASKNKIGGERTLVLKKTKHSFSILNRYPYNNAHVMVSPRRHVKSLELLNDNEILDMIKLVNYTKKKIEKLLKPEGFNIGVNLGRIAGAGVPGHVHIHIVPRWGGDTNFMPVIADTNVISSSLKESYKLLKG